MYTVSLETISNTYTHVTSQRREPGNEITTHARARAQNDPPDYYV